MMSRSQPTSPNQLSGTLQGRRIGVALAADTPYSPGPAMAARGAELVHYPCEEMLPLDDTRELDDALRDVAAGKYDGLLLTTPDAVAALLARLDELGLDADLLHKTKIAAYGADTRLALQALGRNGSSIQPTPDPEPGSRYLLPISAGRVSDWPERFQARDAHVNVVPAYRAHMRRDGDDLPGMLWAGSIDAMVFVSGDNVRHFATRLRHDGGTLAMLDHVPIACIDQLTQAAAAAFGLRASLVAPEPTPEGLAQVLSDHFAASPR